MKEDNNSFLGKGWAFPVTFSEGASAVEMVENEEDIRQSLIILLSTMKKERVMLPDYGVETRAMIFEPLTTSTATILTEKIRHAILFHEPRINLEGITYDQSVYEGKITLTIEYTIIATNTRTNIVYPFYFIEGTDL
ncbi:MAG: GPW/gp25 family protein [Cyclobacteriaceae bacterium]